MGGREIRKALLRRLAFLEADLERGVHEKRERWMQAERSALQAVLERLGLLDEQRLGREKVYVTAVSLPKMDARHRENIERRARLDALVALSDELVSRAQRAARVT